MKRLKKGKYGILDFWQSNS